MGKATRWVQANVGGENNGYSESKAHHVGFSPQENRGGAEEKVGRSAEGIAASFGGNKTNGLRSCQTQNIGSRQEENGGSFKGAVGEVQGAEESGVE
ncbi:MAG: hypothetical protein ABSD53_21815 [Terriglobales bacterium]